MSKYHCFLCASNEGILLDLFGLCGKSLRENIESCLLVKIKRSDASSTKICHKCAWELDCCGKFIQKYKQPRNSEEPRVTPKGKHCILCCKGGSQVFLLTLRRGKVLNNFLPKIQKLFNDASFNEKPENTSICLDCRYNVDVLYDLKNIYNATVESLKSVIQKDLKPSDLPKTKTRVVTRITTQTPSPALSCDSSYDSDASRSSTMSSLRSKAIPHNDNATKPVIQYRKCGECNTSIPYGIDMYRHHRTGVTVCKECWLTMDPEKMVNGKRRKIRNPSTRSGTKLCAVFLKDVLSNPSKYKSVYKTEKDEHGNMTFLITDDSSETDEKEKTSPKRSRKGHVGVGKSEAKATKRSAPTTNEDEPPKKIATKGKTKPVEPSNQPESSTSKAKAKNGGGVSSDTSSSIRTRSGSVQSTTDAPSNSQATQISDAGTNKKTVPKRTRLPKSAVGKLLNPGTKPRIKETSIIEAPAVRSTRTKRIRSNSFTSHDTLPVDNTSAGLNETKAESKLREKKTKNSKTTAPTQKTVKSDSELEKPYMCSVCDVVYKNKLIGMAHQLTHAKQPEVKLERVVVPEAVENTTPEESSNVDQPEEQSHDISSSSDNNSEHPSTAKEVPVSEKPKSDVTTIDRNEDDSKTEKLAEVDEEKDDSESEDLKSKNTEIGEKKEDSEDEDLHLKISEVGQNDEEESEKSPRPVEETTDIDIQQAEKEPRETIEEPSENDIVESDESITESVKVAENETTIDETENTEVAEVTNNENENIEKDEVPKKVNKDKEADEATAEKRDENENQNVIDLTIPECDETIESSSVTEPSENIIEVEKTEPCENDSEQTEKPESPKAIKKTIVNEKTTEVINLEDIPEVEKDDGIKEDVVVDVETDVNITTVDLSEKSDDTDETPIPITVEREEKSPNKQIKKGDSAEKPEVVASTEEPQDKSVEKVETKVPNVPETSEAKTIDGPDSISVASDIVDEVFDLANAEVKKRLEKAKSDDEHCTTPVSETLENISQEIRNSADMPSLELEDQSSNNQS